MIKIPIACNLFSYLSNFFSFLLFLFSVAGFRSPDGAVAAVCPPAGGLRTSSFLFRPASSQPAFIPAAVFSFDRISYYYK